MSSDSSAPRSDIPQRNERTVHIGTRGSPLALVQAHHVSASLASAHSGLEFPVNTVMVRGDIDKVTPFLQMADKAGNPDAVKNLWTGEMETKLCNGELDLLVHCLKDLPTNLPDGCVLGAILKGEDPRDALVVKKGLPYKSLDELPKGAVVGTSSTRRKALLRRRYPHLETQECRGNIDTRLSKLDAADSPMTAIILAVAGLNRLGLQDRINYIPTAGFPYAVGQGDLGIEIRSQDTKVLGLLQAIEDKPQRWRRLAERALLRALQGGCSSPVGVESSYLQQSEEGLSSGASPKLHLFGAVLHPDGSSEVTGSDSAEVKDDDGAETLGISVAEKLRAAGAGSVLDEIRSLGVTGFRKQAQPPVEK